MEEKDMASEKPILGWASAGVPPEPWTCDCCAEEFAPAPRTCYYLPCTFSPYEVTQEQENLGADVAKALDVDSEPTICQECAERYGPDAERDMALWLERHLAREGHIITRDDALHLVEKMGQE
jgi:hypothetical protein